MTRNFQKDIIYKFVKQQAWEVDKEIDGKMLQGMMES